MPMSFQSAVAAPGGASYNTPIQDFSEFGNWAQKFQAGQANEQSRQLGDQQKQGNAQRLQQGQMALDASRAIAGTDFRTKDGGIDYSKVVQTMLKFGDVNGLQQLAPLMMQQQAAGMTNDPLLQPAGGQPQKGPSAGSSAPAPQPQATAPANSPKGDAGTGTVTSLVTDRLPNQDTTTGQTIGKIAQVLGVDPNSNLTPGQIRRAQGLLKQYAPQPAGGGDGGGSNLPPSASAGTPAPPPTAAAQPQGAPIGAGSEVPEPPLRPLRPQEPLPVDPSTGKQFTDPMQAVAALQRRAAEIEMINPKTKPAAEAMRAKADRILEGIKPVAATPSSTLLDPVTHKPLYQNGPSMSSAAIDAAAQRYVESGTLPTNLGKGNQGPANITAIQNRAAEIAEERGINPADLPKRHQEFKAQQVAIQRFESGKQGDNIRSLNVVVDHLSTLRKLGEALDNGDKPFFNSIAQKWAAATGSAIPTNFDMAKQIVGTELVKAMGVAGAGTKEERQELGERVSKASSPAQITGAIRDVAQPLLTGQLKGLRQQFIVATGLPGEKFDQILSPETREFFTQKHKAADAAKPDKDGWISLPNGARIQEVK